MSVNRVAKVLREGKRFLIMTHEDPDIDGIGSMLALGGTLVKVKKDVVFLTGEPVAPPVNRLKGSERIVQGFDPESHFDAVVILDCGKMKRLGGQLGWLEGRKPLINIDHHETNDLFGDLNLVDANSSSTGELVFGVMKVAGFPMDYDAAENIFAAIKTDTGSFRYENTTSSSLKIAAEMIDYGVEPHQISRKIVDTYSLARLRLLEMALGSIEFHHLGRIGIMTITSRMFERARARPVDSERFVDYPRFVSGVEMAVLIRQTGENDYKFSLRSNNEVNVSSLASRFGGGGHIKAAGFERHGSLWALKKDFLKEAVRFLDGIPNRRHTTG
ncbi:MAG: bifunctional oligoribonuclease/PAP phosphatase NrnA [Thermodesulfobacteriota bacterium]|nr:bifunctional oligoribonuclease/PAP phosphatase NrnA [Thermodesulfobacteriota bacterium]